MWFRSTIARKKSVGLTVLMAGIAVAMITATAGPAAARGPAPSPFAGCYGDGTFLVVAVSDSGRIAGDYVGIGISGRIANDGYLELTYRWSTPVFDDPQHGGGRKKFSSSATGIAALDEGGNLFGVLQWDGGSISEFFWPRCK